MMCNQKCRYKLIIFDLDGTLLDTSRGIYNSVRYAEQKMNFNPIDEEELCLFVGPPPKEMYKKIYQVGDKTALQAAKYHREYGREKAIYEATVYQGITELLDHLSNNGIKLAVSTLKSESIAKSILNYYGLSQRFNVIVGMDQDETRTKASTIELAIRQTNSEKEDTLMIGDSEYDLIGAEKVGVSFLGVTYGFGLKSKGVDCNMVDSVAELEKVLLGKG